MDWDLLVFLVWLVGAVVAFAHRRTRLRILYYVWLGLIWLETELRKLRDRVTPPDKRNI
jgi:hypothetical protein